jgi:hypothetical protein
VVEMVGQMTKSQLLIDCGLENSGKQSIGNTVSSSAV